MNKEELKQEAEEWLRKFLLCNDCKRKCHCIELNAYCEEQVLRAYISSAKPREKRITELEAQIEQNKIDLAISEQDREHDDYEFTEVYTKVEQLEKENAKLKCNCRTCVYTDSPCVRSDYPSKDGVCSHYKNVFEEKAELKEENKVLAQNLEDTEILNKTYEKRFDDLKKENAELKLKLEALEGQTPWKDIKDKSEVIGQLTNAKEIISEYVRLANLEKEDTVAIWQLYHKAEQFISEVEK